MTPKEIGQYIKAALDKHGLKEEPFAVQLGIGQTTINRIVRGDFKRMPSELPKICATLGIELPTLGANPKPPGTAFRLPLSAGLRDFPIHAAAEGGAGEIIITSEPIDFRPWPEPLMHVKTAYGLIITGESMVPEFNPGDTALVNPVVSTMAGEPHIFYAEREGTARASIKKLIRATEEQWLVSQHNPPPRKPKDFSLPRKEWRWAHRVIGKYSRP